MAESKFQFANPVLLDSQFYTNVKFEQNQHDEIDMKLNLNVQVNHEEGKNEAFVALTVKAGEKDSEYPFYIEATQGAAFKWDESVDNPDLFLNQNAPALLLSYLRSHISSITSASAFNTYNLPFINFKKDNNEKK